MLCQNDSTTTIRFISHISNRAHRGSETDQKAIHGIDRRIVHPLLVRVHELPAEPIDKVVQEDEDLKTGKHFPGAHPWPPSERHVGEGRGPGSLES